MIRRILLDSAGAWPLAALAAVIGAFCLGSQLAVLLMAGVTVLAGMLVVAIREIRGRRHGRGEPYEITIDLRAPLPRISANDPVTGLVDQMHFRGTLTQRVASARRHLQPLSLVVFELDGFERAKGDKREQAMRLLGSTLRRTLRECDIACRFGEAAVAALLEDTPESGAAQAAERVRKALAATPTGRNLVLSAGIACYPSHALDAHELLRRSVQALATARVAGRDWVEIAGPE